MKSRELYLDCIKAKEMFEKFVQQKKLSEAKILWFSCLSMLRAIGHVLDKVDSKNRSEIFSKELKIKYQHWKTDDIFSNFIDSERNNIVKEYESSLVEIKKETIYNITYNDCNVTYNGDNVIHTSTVTDLVKKHGEFSNESPISALNNALAWWDKELLELERIK